ncbi:MAG: hypothetical protein ACLTOU_06095 [Acutalibacter sp.]
MDELITLVKQETVQLETGAMDVKETFREVWATLTSVYRQEFLEAGRDGLNPELVATTPLVNYQGEQSAVVRGIRYGVYRTYMVPNSDMIEIYLEGKAGA